MHQPVLRKETIEYLDPKSGQNFVDCTLGEGGHTEAILEKIRPDGKVMAIDLDKRNVERLEEKEGLIAVWGNFANLKEIVLKNNFNNIKGILIDLGVSMWHIKESGKGFTFLKDELLDMRYSANNPITAWQIINRYSLDRLEEIFKDYGEEKFAKRIAKEIIEKREKNKITTTFELSEIIRQGIPSSAKQRINPATRIFQALRIEVNEELDNLKKVLPSALEVLDKKGRLAVISFHSLEDRIIKNYFKEKEKEGFIKIITKKPITPSQKEIKNNIASRSAKLRVAEKI